MKRSIIFPALALIAAGLIYAFYPSQMDHDAMSMAKPEKMSAAISQGDIVVSGAWTKAMLPGQPAGGGYLTIENKGAADDRLMSATSPVSTNLQVHEMAMEGDVMKMRELPEGLVIPAGGKVELKPGGYHLMFLDMTNGFKENEKVAVTLKFEKAGDFVVNLPVNAAGK